eukprot:11085250-Lingulodinium_polyedra.AAC.1
MLSEVQPRALSQAKEAEEQRSAMLEAVFLGVGSGSALVDCGAGQDLVCLRAYEREVEFLAVVGLQPVRL